MAYVDDMASMHGQSVEVRVHALGGQRSSFWMDKFGLIGDVKQRLSKELGRKFHEMKLLCNGTSEPDMMDKVTTFRGRSGTVDFTVVVNRTCRWCHAQITDRNTVNCKLDTEIGDFCSLRCYTLMAKEVADPANSVFHIFGLNAEPSREMHGREMQQPSHHQGYAYTMQNSADPWAYERRQY